MRSLITLECDFIPVKGDELRKRCARCKLTISTPNPATMCHARCKGRRGLGDWIMVGLYWLGIRKRPGCGCEKRQAWLNRVWFKMLERFKR